MKKVLLLSGALAGITSMAQNITINDTLYSGLSTAYYVMDSTAAEMSGTTGTGVTWNYSTLGGYENATTPDVIIDAAGSAFAANFPTAAYNDDLSTGASLYFSNTDDSVTVHGYVFSADGNQVIIMHNINPLKALTFPMTVGDSYSDDIEGEADISGNTFPATGTATVTVDGFGTLMVSGNTHTNILRVKLVEVIDASITFPFPVSGTVTRTVYSYYDLANDKQAIFVHATIDVASDVLNDNYTAVYYSGTPNYFLGSEEMNQPVLSVYPNPATDVVMVTTSGSAASLVVINALGQVVFTVTNPQAVETINTTDFAAGVYLIQINQNGILTEQKLIVE